MCAISSLSDGLYVVIPAYNAEKTLGHVLEKLTRLIPPEKIVVVDDGSTDQTAGVAKSTHISVVSHNSNQGKGAALQSGFEHCLRLNARYILTMDADAQHDVADIQKFVHSMAQNQHDFVIGSRMSDLTKMPIHRRLSNRLTSKLVSWRIQMPVVDSQSGFRLFKAEILKHVELKTRHYEMESELLLKAALQGYRIGFVNISTIYADNSVSYVKAIDVWRFISMYIRSFWDERQMKRNSAWDPR